MQSSEEDFLAVRRSELKAYRPKGVKTAKAVTRAEKDAKLERAYRL